jgi:hypothetical protein
VRRRFGKAIASPWKPAYRTGIAIATRLAQQRFTLFANGGTGGGVTNSYLGIITSRGLEKLVVETQHAAPFLLRRAGRQPSGEAIVFWAVLDEKAAKAVTERVACGHFQEALCQLNGRAIHLGTLPPSLPDEELLHTAS